MRIIAVENPGPDYVLKPAEAPAPAHGPHEILIKTAAAGVNRADLLQAKGKYPPPPGASLLLGMEVSGEVAAAGAEVTAFRPGDQVCALMAGGGYAEYAIAHERCTLPIPKGFDLPAAAGLPEAIFTVWTNLFDTAHLKPGETVLIHGGTSGIGTAAIQLCAALGCHVLATAAGREKSARCRELGAHHAIDYTSEDYVEEVRKQTGGQGADVILDMVGGDYIERNMEAAAQQGRIVNIAFQKGPIATVNFAPMLQKRLTLAATTLRGRSIAEKGVLRDAVLTTVWPLIEAGKIRPVIDRIFPLAEAGAAHARMRDGGHIGKILLTL